MLPGQAMIRLRAMLDRWRRPAMVLPSIIPENREEGQEWAIRTVGIAGVVTVEPGIVHPIVVGPGRRRKFFGRRRPRYGATFGGQRVGRGIGSTIVWSDVDNCEAAVLRVPADLDSENRICPGGISHERLVAEHVTLIEEKLNEGVFDLVQLGLGEHSLVIHRDNGVGVHLPHGNWRRARRHRAAS